ncbi:hypothetical protein BGZ75_000147 [Mortierella antarctica]|nr:hypothetical protein BGZ75_000147 [Mortierella antarctica]
MYGLSHLDHIQALDRSTGSTSPPPQRVTEAIASGAALASTSIAIAVTMMKQQRVLDSPVGTLITTAAMLDDVVSLILLGIVSSIGQSESASGSGIHAMTVIQPVVASLGIIGVGIVGSVVVARIKAMKTPNVGHELDLDMSDRRHAQDEHGLESADARVLRENSHGEEDRQRGRNQPGWIWSRVIHLCSRFEAIVKLAGMVTSGLGYSILAEYLGSSRLLGAFVAGVFFSPFVNLQHEYEQQVTIRIQPALSALFFASIGMAIPLTKLLEPALFGWGLVYAVIASLSKLTTMFVVSSKASLASAPGLHGVESGCNVRWMVGTAMIARGELGLLMAQQAQQQGVMSQTAMVVTTWSIVLCTLFGIGALGVVMTNK